MKFSSLFHTSLSLSGWKILIHIQLYGIERLFFATPSTVDYILLFFSFDAKFTHMKILK